MKITVNINLGAITGATLMVCAVSIMVLTRQHESALVDALGFWLTVPVVILGLCQLLRSLVPDDDKCR